MPKYQTYGQYDEANDTFPDSAEKVLRSSEDAAALRTTEQDFATRIVYNNTAKGEAKGSFFKRRAPIFAVVGIIGVMLAGIGFSQALMPFHVVESLTEMTDGAFTARQARAPYLLKWLFNMEGADNVQTGAFSTTKYRRSLTTTRMQNRLKTEGIEVDTSGSATVLKYQQPDGSIRTVTADEYADVYRSDSDFRNKMNRGGRSFLGRIASHIDLTIANFLDSHNLTKNLFKNWINKVYDAEGQTAQLHNIIETRSPTSTGDVVDFATSTEKDADGVRPTKDGRVNVTEDAGTVHANYAEMITNVANISTSVVCGTAAVASAVTAAKIVIAQTNARGYFSGIAEIKDKAAAGDDSGELDVAAEDLGRPDENGKTALDSETMKLAISGGNYRVNTSAADVVDYSADSLFRSNSVLGGIGTSAKWIIGCAAAGMATAAISIILNVATLGTFSVGKAILTAGFSLLTSEAVGLLAQTLVANAKSNFCTEAVGPSRGACIFLGATNYNGLNFQNGGASLATKEKAAEFYDSYQLALADEAELIRTTKSPFDLSSSHTFLGNIVAKISMLSTAAPSLASIASTLINTTSASLAALLPTAAAFDKTAYFDSQVRYDCPNLDFGTFVAIGDINCEPVRITDQSMNQYSPEVAFEFLAERGSFELNADGSLKVGENGVEQIRSGSLLGKYIKYCAYRNSQFGSVDQNIMSEETGITNSNTLNKLIDAFPVINDLAQLYENGKQIASLGWSTGANCVARSSGDEITSSNSNVTDAEVAASWTESVPLESWDDFMKYAQVYVEDDRTLETADSSYVSAVQTFLEKEGLLQPDDKLSLVEYLAKYSGYTVENMQIALNEVEYWTYIAQYDPAGKGPLKFEEETIKVYDFATPQIVPADHPDYLADTKYLLYPDLRNRYTAVA